LSDKLVEYYNGTATTYDSVHSETTNPEHRKALELGWPLVPDVRSALDVGCGTGRTLRWLQNRNPELDLYGIEPSAAMLQLARQNLLSAKLQQGNGEALPYATSSIDIAIATGIMHHVDHPSKVISEMFRVARKGILISDHNNYAFGSNIAKRVRMGLKVAGLLNAFTFVKQGFKRQGYSDDDGWWYPYSLLENYNEVAKQSTKLYIMPTRPATGAMGNIIFCQSHFCLVAVM
jgi:SAM-dependent methyltransferase